MPKAELRWIITRIRGKRADRIGVVKAPDADAAVKAAIREFQIPDTDRKRIGALRDDRTA
jgi:hypothetical protein